MPWPGTLLVNLKEMHCLHLASVLCTTDATIQHLMGNLQQLKNMFLANLPNISITTESLFQLQEMPTDLYEKSECLFHYSYGITDHKLMLLDIQGPESTLYDPETKIFK